MKKSKRTSEKSKNISALNQAYNAAIINRTTIDLTEFGFLLPFFMGDSLLLADFILGVPARFPEARKAVLKMNIKNSKVRKDSIEYGITSCFNELCSLNPNSKRFCNKEAKSILKTLLGAIYNHQLDYIDKHYEEWISTVDEIVNEVRY
jgi:hypothetical protein